jgi:putative FmdB family regulatory protein
MKYEYECSECGTTLTVYRSIHDIAPDYTCPSSECGATLRRNWDTPAVHFRGSGFYSTDSK